MLKIYGVPISVHTRKVILAARFKQLPFELVPVVPVLPDSPPPHWRTLSPTGLIPVLEDGEFTLADSAAICAYLEQLHPTPPLYPQGARERAKALWYEQYAGGTLFRSVVHPLFHEVVVNPRIHQMPTQAARVDAVLTRDMPEAFGYLDSVAGDGFLVGGAVSVADLAVVSNLVNWQYIGFALDRNRFPRLAGLYDRVVRLPLVTAALREEQPAVRQMGLASDFLGAVLSA